MTNPTTKPSPLTPEREAIVRQQQPGEWLPGPWMIREVEGTADEQGCWHVTHQGKVLATLPDWAGNLALWIAETREDVPELLATLDAERAKVAALEKRVAELERSLGETIDDRDRAQDAADKLAYAIAPTEVIGEHSSENNPWKNALEHVTPLAEVKPLRSQLVAPKASGTQPHCKAECGGPGYTHCELPPGHEGQHEAAMGNMRRTTWGPVR